MFLVYPSVHRAARPIVHTAILRIFLVRSALHNACEYIRIACHATTPLLPPHLSLRLSLRLDVYGHIETPFWSGIAEGFSRVTGQTTEDVIEGFRQTVPWGRFGTVGDVAAAVSWLASPDAEYVSGQAIAMNGAEFPF